MRRRVLCGCWARLAFPRAREKKALVVVVAKIERPVNRTPARLPPIDGWSRLRHRNRLQLAVLPPGRAPPPLSLSEPSHTPLCWPQKLRSTSELFQPPAAVRPTRLYCRARDRALRRRRRTSLPNLTTKCSRKLPWAQQQLPGATQNTTTPSPRKCQPALKGRLAWAARPAPTHTPSDQVWRSSAHSPTPPA